MTTTALNNYTCLREMNIKFYTRSFNLELYNLSKGLYDMLGIPSVRLTDQTADGYFYTMLADKSCDVAINIDEDAFMVCPDAVLRLANNMVCEGYANAGCPDGGGYCPRSGNPLVTNPFFNIFNLKLIRTKFNLNNIRAFRYTENKQRMIDGFPKERLETDYTFDRYEYEPYYPFFLWLAGNFKTLYLPSKRHSDGISTILMDSEGNDLVMHSWFARFYDMPSFMVKLIQNDKGQQKQRIDNLIHEVYNIRQLQIPVFSFTDRFDFLCNKTIRWMIKIPQRISRWPYKIKRKLSLRRTQ